MLIQRYILKSLKLPYTPRSRVPGDNERVPDSEFDYYGSEFGSEEVNVKDISSLFEED